MERNVYLDTVLESSISEIFEQVEPKNLFLVTGGSSYEQSGAKERLSALLKKYEVTHYSEFSPNPTLEEVETGIKKYRESGPDIVIALGGGSAIDIAKSVATLALQDGDASDYVTGKRTIETPPKPLVAIPTTAGTGSEATHFAVVYIGSKKYSLAHKSMLPTYAVVDPSLTYSLPPYVTACTGADALSQAIESMWSINSTEESVADAEEAMQLIVKHFVSAVTEGGEEARSAMSRAAYYAGRAINISKTTASHAMSYPITAHFNVPHGHAVCVTLPELLLFNYAVTEDDVVDARGVAHVRRAIEVIGEIFGSDTPEKTAKKLRSLFENVGLETCLSGLGVSEDNLDRIVSEISPERAGNNPRKFERKDAEGILCAIL